MRIKLDFWGDTQLDRTLADIGERADDMRPVWDVLADRFGELELRQFSSEGRFGSGGWSPLSPRYALWKARHYPGQPILRRTDDLFRSLTERPFGVEVLEPGYMIVGSDVEYGQHHQAPGVEGRPPRRRPVEFPETERVEWVRTIQRYLMTGDAG